MTRRDLLKNAGALWLASFAFPRIARGQLPADSTPDFAIAYIPDQHMNPTYPAAWQAISAWLVANYNTAPWNLQATVLAGDVTVPADGDGNQTDLTSFATNGLSAVLATGMPTSITVGNHDYTTMGALVRDSRAFDTTCGYSLVSGKSWGPVNAFSGAGNDVGLHAMTNTNACFAIRFAYGSHKFLVLNVPFFPPPECATWALDLMGVHPDHICIVNTHCVLNIGGTLTADADTYGPNFYWGPGSGAMSAVTLFGALKSAYNFQFFWGGHWIGGFLNCSHMEYVGTGTQGQKIQCALTDYQDYLPYMLPSTAYGMFTIYLFRPSLDLVQVYVVNALGCTIGTPSSDPNSCECSAWPEHPITYMIPTAITRYKLGARTIKGGTLQ
jgi:hypothetical protein